MKRSRPATPNSSTDTKTCLRFMTLQGGFSSAFRRTHCSLLWSLQHTCIFLQRHLPQGHQPGITREGGCSHVTRLFFTRDRVNSILYTSWNPYKLLLSMLIFLLTVSMFFLPPDEFQADGFLKVAEKTLPPPAKQTSPAVITEGGDDPNGVTGCYTNAPLCPPTTTAGKLQQAAGAFQVAGSHSKRLPAPCDGQLCFWTV